MTTSALHFTPMPTKWVGPIKITGEVINEAVRVPLATYETPLWPSTDRARGCHATAAVSVVLWSMNV